MIRDDGLCTTGVVPIDGPSRLRVRTPDDDLIQNRAAKQSPQQVQPQTPPPPPPYKQKYVRLYANINKRTAVMNFCRSPMHTAWLTPGNFFGDSRRHNSGRYLAAGMPTDAVGDQPQTEAAIGDKTIFIAVSLQARVRTSCKLYRIRFQSRSARLPGLVLLWFLV